MNDPYVFLGVVGSVASIVSLAIAAPTARSRFLHIAYAMLLTAITGLGITQLVESKKKEEALQLRIRKLEEIERQATKLLDSHGYSYTDDVGMNRGFFLAGLAFLEKNKGDFPEVYQIAKQLAVSGLKITESAGEVGSSGYFDERKRMNDGAQAMKAMLRGIAGGTESR